jgi:flavorubredoxin
MLGPIKVNDETYVVPSHLPIPHVGLLYHNTFVIKGEQPMIVDTGVTVHREHYLENLFSLVDPVDVRWLFLSHEDRDHSGSLMQVLEMCPNARLVSNFVGVGKLSEEFALPMDRVYLANDGDSLDIGDRVLSIMRPPVFDSPATRGFWDPKNEVFFSADSFGTVIPEEAEDVADVPADAFAHGFFWFNRANHAWHELADPAKVDAQIDRVRALGAKTLMSAHGPVAHGRTDELCDMLAQVSRMPRQELPSQADLEADLAAGSGGH